MELSLILNFIDPTFVTVTAIGGVVIILDSIFTPNTKLINYLAICGGYAIVIYKFLGILIQLLKTFMLIGVENNEQ